MAGKGDEMKDKDIDIEKVFSLAQGYTEPSESHRWAWPQGTWLQRRRATVAARGVVIDAIFVPSCQHCDGPATECGGGTFHNVYYCADCKVGWADDWCCQCNDRCPACDAEIEPE